ncbi:MAG: DUF748 domain-containing protein [Marinomonas sp.]
MKKPWRNYLIIPSISLFVIIFITWLLTPVIAKHYLVNYFSEQGESASISNLSVDFFPPKVTLKKLNVLSNDKQTLAIGALSIGIEAFPLFTKTINITEANIDGLTLDISQKNKQWIVAGIDLSQYQTATETELTENKTEESIDTTSPWAITLPAFRVTNSLVHLTRQETDKSPLQQDTLTINALAIDDLVGEALSWKGNVSIDALINTAKINVVSEFDYSPDTATANITLNKNSLPIEDFSHFLPIPYNQGTGQLAVNGKLLLSMKTNDQDVFFTINSSTLAATAKNLVLPLQNTLSISTKSTELTLADISANYSTNQTANLAGSIQLNSQSSAFSEGKNKTSYQALALKSVLSVQQKAHENEIKSNQIDMTLKGVNALQDGKTASISQLQLTLNDLLTTLNSESQNVDLKSTIKININDATTQLPDQQQASFKSASLSTPLIISKNNSVINTSSSSIALAIKGLSLGLTSLVLNNDSTSIQLNNLTAKQTADKQASLSVNSKVISSGLSAQQADNKVNYANLVWSNTLSMTQNAEATSIKNTLFDLVIDSLKVEKKDTIQSTLANTKLTASNINIDLNGAKSPKIEGNGINLSTTEMDSKLTPEKRAASWKTANLSNLTISQQGDVFAANLATLSINDLVASAPISSTSTLPPLATIAQIEINQVNANQDGANIKSIVTKDVNAKVFLDKERRIDNLVFIDTSQQTSPNKPNIKKVTPKINDANNAMAKTSNATQDQAFKAPYYIILNSYDLTGKSSVYIEDKGVKPALKRTLDITKLALRNLNTKDAKQATTVSVRMKNGKYTTLDGDVKIWPMADELTLQSVLKVAQAELPPYSPYIANVLGYQIDSGQLNLDLKLNADKGDLSGKGHLVLKQFDLGGSYNSSSAIKSGVIPLNLAVSALKDSDDNIDLDIPLSGNIDSPSFGWGDFLFIPVKKALFSASSSYLLQTFVPYANVITIAQFASNQLLKIRVKPLIYLPGETKADAEKNIFLKQLVALLKDKKESELKVCGVASYLDLGFTEPLTNIDNKTRDKANALAEERAINLKDYLVAQQINSARIFVCSPEADFSKGSQPRIELNF